MKLTIHLFSSADESLKDEKRLLLLCLGLLVHTLVFMHITSAVLPLYILMTKSRVSKSRLKAELCFNRYVYFACVPIYTYIFI